MVPHHAVDIMDMDDVGNTNSHASEETDLTDVEDIDEEGQDLDDLAELLADNEHPPDYYLNLMENIDESLLDCNEYADTSLHLLDRIEREWFKS
ncbi:hypothetical protein FQN57_001797 [Myotisia sp. PD_48]|nr:hypothetical protein FQN57_001797 [Myotisia sp. PD_48]